MFLFLLLSGIATAQALLPIPANTQAPHSENNNSVYLPLLFNTDDFYQNQPIWAFESLAQPHEVALFRVTFDLPQSLANVHLQLFADTRYQAWLDEAEVGHGPARFAQSYRQYDSYTLESLSPGEHVMAVLVQWSPDDRRSESIRPLLQGALHGYLPDGSHFILRTGPTWKAMLSPAWRGDAALVHQWNLIGFTELLDLNLLPADWGKLDFLAEDWPQAVVVDPIQKDASLSDLQERLFPGRVGSSVTELSTSIRYTPRDINFPIEEAVPVVLLDSGLLLADRAIGELPAGTPAPYNLPFQANITTPFFIETLGVDTPPYDSLILLDGISLAWQPADSLRPDVYLAQTELPAGEHTLTFSPPAEGLTFALSTNNLSGLALPFQQGNHAGRRLLLAEPSSQMGIVNTNPGDLEALEFNQLPAYAVLDLGRVVHGRIAAQVSGPVGAVVDIGWDERLLEGTLRPLPYPGSLHPQWNQTDSWILDGISRQLTTIDARSGRYILIAVWGNGPVRLDNLVVTSEHYPLTQAGTFESSDPQLDQIWQIGAYTVQLNMVDAYMDPWRERGQWWGDSYVIDKVNQVAFGDVSLLRRGLLFMEIAFSETMAPGCAPHNNNLHMLDYAMLWVHSLASYAQRTGDLDLLVETYPTLQQFAQHLESYHNSETGLLDLPKATWTETAYIDTLGFYSRYGQSTALNAMYYATLLKAADIASLVGDPASQELWQGKANTVKINLNALLYLPDQGRYLTNIYNGEAYPPTLYAQAWALAYGLVPDSEQSRVADALLELLSSDPAAPNVGTYGYYWILEALGQAGTYDQALILIKSYYGRLIDRGATTWWENFLADENYSNALSHGWGSSPTWFLTSYILGVRQVASDEWTLQPAIDTLQYVSGTMPLAQGTLQTSWQRTGCSSGMATDITHLELNAPLGTHGQLILPLNPFTQWVTIDSTDVWRKAESSVQILHEFTISLDGGKHSIEIGTLCATLP